MLILIIYAILIINPLSTETAIFHLTKKNINLRWKQFNRTWAVVVSTFIVGNKSF